MQNPVKITFVFDFRTLSSQAPVAPCTRHTVLGEVTNYVPVTQDQLVAAMSCLMKKYLEENCVTSAGYPIIATILTEEVNTEKQN